MSSPVNALPTIPEMVCPGAPKRKRHYQVTVEPVPALDFDESDTDETVSKQPSCPLSPPRKKRELVCPGAPLR